jgi:hypothetical protein
VSVPIFRGKVVDGTDGKLRIVLDNPEAFRRYLPSLKNKRVQFVVREREALGTDQQRKFYHKVLVGHLIEKTGYEHKEMHEMIKKDLGVITTTKFTTAEWTDFIDRVKRWAAQNMEISLPDTDQWEA